MKKATISPKARADLRGISRYRTIAEGIEVLRILHDAMDFPRHFK